MRHRTTHSAEDESVRASTDECTKPPAEADRARAMQRAATRERAAHTPLHGAWSALRQRPYNNNAGCVAAEDPTQGPACQAALDALTQCELAACVSHCPATDAGTAELVGTFDSTGNLTTPGCIENALNGTTCQTYVDAVNTVCASEVNDAGTGALDTCNALAQFQTIADVETYFGVVCGGLGSGSGDAGDAGDGGP